MADKEKVKQKLKRLKEKLKDKEAKKDTVGDVKIPGVSKPKKKKKKHFKDNKKDPEATKPTGIGPRGGQYTTTASGKKQYVRKSLEAFLEHIKFEDFFKRFKQK